MIVGSASSIGIRSLHFNTVSTQILNLLVSNQPNRHETHHKGKDCMIHRSELRVINALNLSLVKAFGVLCCTV